MSCPPPPKSLKPLEPTSELEQARRAHSVESVWIPFFVAVFSLVATVAIVAAAVHAGRINAKTEVGAGKVSGETLPRQ